MSLRRTKHRAVDLDSLFLILFYSPECHLSKEALPAKLQMKNLAGFKIRGYPTILLLLNGIFAEFSGDNTVKELEKFVSENLTTATPSTWTLHLQLPCLFLKILNL